MKLSWSKSSRLSHRIAFSCFQNFWRGNKTQEEKIIRQWNSVSYWNITLAIFFSKNPTQIVLEILVPEPFLKNICLVSLKFYKVYCYYYDQVEDYQNVLKLKCWPLAFISCKAFRKNKKRSITGLSASFSAWFSYRNIIHFICY